MTDMERDAFGNYLAGLTDGEGCFMLRLATSPSGCVRGKAGFAIALRDDDWSILEQIRVYLGCGSVVANGGGGTPNAKPRFAFAISRSRDLAKILVPHFERYPLRAKKSRDYAIWKQGVEMVYRISRRPFQGFGFGGGSKPKWTRQERADFYALYLALKAIRKYESSPSEDTTKLIVVSPDDPQLLMFDDPPDEPRRR